MPISINGSGTITGINAGGLPDGVITTDDIAANAVTTAKLGSNEASGLCKAWVNFNGTGAVAIRASYNVSSITDNGTGDYTVNFAAALADANYSFCGTSYDASFPLSSGGVSFGPIVVKLSSTAGGVRASTRGYTGTANSAFAIDPSDVSIAIFR
jgi:hypothetical protein